MTKDIPGKLNSSIFKAFAQCMDSQFIYICDVNSNLWRWSPNAVREFNLPGEYIQDLPELWLERVHPEDRDRVRIALEKITGGSGEEHNCEYRVRNANGTYVWVCCHGCLVYGEDGRPDLCAGILTDLGSRSKFDATTGLYSFHEFQNVLDEILSDPSAEGGLLLFGIDHFRRFNDFNSYTFGNELLHEYGALLLSTVPAKYRLYRMLGDQFAVVCPEAVREDIEKIFHAISDIGGDGVMVHGRLIRFSVTGGAVLYPEHGNNAEEVYTNLEYALELSKKYDREGVTFFASHSHREALNLYRLQEKLHESVSSGFCGFHLYYQPLMGNDLKEVVGAEALLRWSDPEFPGITPADFIPLLEESGDINAVGRWVLTTALEQFKQWQKKLPHLKVSVNVSYLQFQDITFRDFVLAEMERLQFPKKQLVLELTESCNVVNSAELNEDLKLFREAGIQIALDDFGTGYASLSILRDLTADWVKVDQTFVAQIANNDFDNALTEHLIRLCQKLGLSVCVEGIETEEIQDIIQAYQPALLQGYYYSQPVAEEEFEEKFIG